MAQIPLISFSVMIADSDFQERQLLEFTLARMRIKIEAKIFSACEELIIALSRVVLLPDLILIENKMTGITGIECIQKMRTIKRYDNLKIALFTNNSQRETIKEAVAAGADYYVLKPYDISQTVQVIEWMLLHERDGLSARKTFALTEDESHRLVSYPV